MSRALPKLAFVSQPNARERAAENLAGLADLAFKIGDRKLAEQLIDRLYAHYDRQLSKPHPVLLH